MANGAGGGVLFNTVTFDASGTALSGTTVTAGNWNIGQGTAANQRVGGNGLDLEAVTGNLSFGTLNIFNNVGTGLLVNTKTAGTTFSLSNTGGVINTNSGSAMNLDPLTANLTFSSVTSSHAGQRRRPEYGWRDGGTRRRQRDECDGCRPVDGQLQRGGYGQLGDRERRGVGPAIWCQHRQL